MSAAPDWGLRDKAYNRILRARDASGLLASLDQRAAQSQALSMDGVAAVAEYVRRDLDKVLDKAVFLPRAPAG